jgi:hypothetical protein
MTCFLLGFAVLAYFAGRETSRGSFAAEMRRLEARAQYLETLVNAARRRR